MSFVSWQYPFFLLAVVALYWRLPLRGRWWLLLGASYLFYAAWDVRFVALLLTSTSLDYFCGRAIAGERRPLSHVALLSALPLGWLIVCREVLPHLPVDVAWPDVGGWSLAMAAVLPVAFTLLYAWGWRLAESRRARAFVTLSIASNLAVLGFFKYFNFFAVSLVTLLAGAGITVHWTLPTILLPIAISFYTFQSISYAVDIHRGKAHPARDFVLFAAYLGFFPQLVSGPIERAGRFLPQFETPRVWDPVCLHQGLRLILVGLFKKMVVADNCALVANHVFDPRTPLDGWWAALGVVAFAFQIYGDFSGYTDLARGSARLLGIELSNNFQFPYLARGPSEFWQRWHITLSTWFRDYVYIPLGGNRDGTGRTLLNLWITMVVAGLWHGASWTFVLWGAYHALLLSLYRLATPLARLEASTSRMGRIVAVALMFGLTLGGWAIFRCTSLAQLTHWVAALATWPAAGAISVLRPAGWVLVHVAPLVLWQWATVSRRDEAETDAWPWGARGLAYAVVLLLVASSAANDQEFIYFQF
jgi:D-alanyl-lipoteichoic acid acyltransferase DltB (MBOAT superfamily)